jgi:hypothetical protein
MTESLDQTQNELDELQITLTAQGIDTLSRRRFSPLPPFFPLLLRDPFAVHNIEHALKPCVLEAEALDGQM